MSSGAPELSSSHDPTGSQASPSPSESESIWRLVLRMTAGFETVGQSSTASGTLSRSMSSSVVEQPPVFTTPPRTQTSGLISTQVVPGPWQSLVAVQITAGVSLQWPVVGQGVAGQTMVFDRLHVPVGR